jgi:hypothetical protein
MNSRAVNKTFVLIRSSCKKSEVSLLLRRIKPAQRTTAHLRKLGLKVRNAAGVTISRNDGEELMKLL